jgi:HK97 family phage major capsid protein
MALSTRRAPRTGVQCRYASQLGAKSVVDEDTRTLDLSFSSEARIPRWFGTEILSHADGAVDLSRVDSGDAPLLLNHAPDQIVGTVESARVVGGKGRATVRFAKTAEGQRAMDLVNDRILRSVSVGYLVNRYAHTPAAADDDDDEDAFTATRWAVMELSLVAVPADTSVGVGRSLTPKDRRTMENDPSTENDPPLTRSQRAASRREADAERERAARLGRIAQQHQAFDRLPTWLDTGTSVEEASAEILERRATRPFTHPPAETGDNAGLRLGGSGRAGLSAKEQRQFSIVRALQGAMSGDWSTSGFEREVIQATYRSSGKQPTTERELMLPTDLAWNTRAPYAVGALGTGGALVETTLLAGEFIEVLRNASVTGQLGARYIGGLQGNIDIPRQDTQSTGYWVGESVAVTESEATFDKLQLRPKTVGALSTISRLMMIQSTPDIEAVVMTDFVKVMALALDSAALFGSGSSAQPLGIMNTSGIGSVGTGTNGDNASFDLMIALKNSLLTQNVPMANLGFAINGKTWSALANLKASTGTYLWMPTGYIGQGPSDRILGDRYAISNQLPSNGTKGTGTALSTAIYGNWQELLIAQWGGIQILLNPYESTYYEAGDVRVRILQTVDIGVRHAPSFAACSDIITSPY